MHTLFTRRRVVALGWLGFLAVLLTNCQQAGTSDYGHRRKHGVLQHTRMGSR